MTSRRLFDAVCFDFDSTLTRIEGIDELAARIGAADQIAPLTAAAMDGSLPLDQVYGRRMMVVRPDRAAIAWLAERYIEEMVAGAKEAVFELQAASVAVHIVSGGLLPAIVPMADMLGVQPQHVHAVDIVFGPDGAYLDFDHRSPLCRPDGKAAVCRALRAAHPSIALVGDGVTDIAARDAGVFVVGFGGVVSRDAVRRAADAFVAEPDLRATLDILLFRRCDQADTGDLV